ncbi:anti-phage ZorAB system protein ZorA [Sphingomicrobium sp. XHP0235]|uniref:anti-phage ZorAB system protein ZorA n=1 Tax=Sphingomicrobium aquimarinum TaxID=3133971 RepID=UPI0031FEED43
MNEILEQILDLFLGVLDFVYGERWVAPFVLLPIMFAAAFIVRQRAKKKVVPYLAAARERIDALQSALGTDRDPDAERRTFAENYIEVSGAMGGEQEGAHNLVQAWREFQESMVDESASPVRNTNRPSAFFNRAAPKLTVLHFASNIFVGVGLILTFLGLIVALNTAAQNMGEDITAAKLSLEHLLTVAGAKFFTSVAGLGASIWLRFTEYSLSKKIRRDTDLICELLERGLLYVSPQRLAVEQLDVLREQRDQLKFFNTDVALQLSERIGAQFTQAIAPVAASLTELNDNMTSVTQGIGAGAREAIEKVSGEQLRGLSETLGELRGKLDAIGQTVGNSGADAANQIRLAGEDFSKAASDIREAFDRLAGQVDSMGARITEQSDAAQAAQQKALADILAGIEDAQARSNTMLTTMLTTLQTAGSEAAGSIQQEVEKTLKSGVEASGETFRKAVEASSGELRDTTKKLSDAVGEAAQQVERASVGFSQSSEKAAQTAEAMRNVTDSARTVATSMSDAAQGFASAAGPVAEAARSVSQAAGRVADTVEADRAAAMAALTEMRSLADSIRSTQQSAETAWSDYRARFEGVDQALSKATEKLAETLGDSLTQFRKFAQETDREMAAAVSRLSNTLTQIEEYAESLDDFVEETRTIREAAE